MIWTWTRLFFIGLLSLPLFILATPIMFILDISLKRKFNALRTGDMVRSHNSIVPTFIVLRPTNNNFLCLEVDNSYIVLKEWKNRDEAFNYIKFTIQHTPNTIIDRIFNDYQFDFKVFIHK